MWLFFWELQFTLNMGKRKNMKSTVLEDFFHGSEYEPQNNNSSGSWREKPAGKPNNFHSYLILEQMPNSPLL